MLFESVFQSPDATGKELTVHPFTVLVVCLLGGVMGFMFSSFLLAGGRNWWIKDGGNAGTIMSLLVPCAIIGIGWGLHAMYLFLFAYGATYLATILKHMKG